MLEKDNIEREKIRLEKVVDAAKKNLEE